MVSFVEKVIFWVIIIIVMKEIDNEKVGKFIENLRKEKGLTQQDLADILSVSNQAVSKWESGRNLPDIAIQRVICDTFNITMEELHAGERDIKKRNKTKKIRKENKIFSIALMCIVPVMVFFVVYFIINFRALKIYYSNSQITNEENSIRANLLIFKLPRKLIIFINNIYPCNYEVKDSDLLDLKLYSGNKKLLNSSMIKNDVFELDALTFDPNNVKLILNIESVTGEKRKFQREVKLVKYTSNDRNDDKYKNKSLKFLSNDEIVKKLLKDGYINTENKVYEKEIIENNATTRVKYDLDHENINILYIHNEYTEKISIDYQVKIFQTIVFNNNNINNISEKYIFDLKNEKNICEIGECATLKKTRKMVEKYLSQLQVG